MNLDILFDESVPFESTKLEILEKVINSQLSGHPAQMKEARLITERLTSQTQLWLHTQSIVQNSRDTKTIFFILSHLTEEISKKWFLLSIDQSTNLRNFIASLVFKWSSETPTNDSKLCLGKANSALVEIVKREWRTSWKTAISDIVQSSFQSQNVCSNNLVILRELSQEIFDSSKKQMTSNEINELKENFANEFKTVYQICEHVLRAYIQNPAAVGCDLAKSCLKTLHSFLGWMPSYYILMTDLMDSLLSPLLVEKRLIISVIKCFEEIFGLDFISLELSPEEQDKLQQKILGTFKIMIEQMSKLLPNSSFEREHRILMTQQQKNLNFFIILGQSLTSTLSVFYRTHLKWLVNWLPSQQQYLFEIIEILTSGLRCIASYTEVKEPSLFKTCVEFWLFYSKFLSQIKPTPSIINIYDPVQEIFTNLELPMNQVIVFLMLRTPKPQEVLIITDEDGLPRREELTNTENLLLYEQVREILRIFAYSHCGLVSNIIMSKVEKQSDGSEWSFENISALSFATGCLAELKSLEEEKSLLIFVLKSLLQLCASKKSTDEKAVIASNIMHIVSQNTRFLKSFPDFLITVARKLVEFAGERFPGVPEMACNILLKLAKELGRELVSRNNTTTIKGSIEQERFVE